MKKCYSCKEEKTIESFHNDRSRKDGKNPLCKVCHTANVSRCYRRNPEIKKASIKKWREANKERVDETGWKFGIKQYGITPEIYFQMLEEQDNKCAICFTTEPGAKKKRFSVDHCHKTGRVRGLLCQYCNKALGGFMDNTEILGSAIKYIIKSTSY